MTANPPDAFAAAAPGERLLPWREVKALAGLSRTTAWRLQNAGDFPRPVAISPGRVAWRESEVAAWKASLTPRGAAAARPWAAMRPQPAPKPKPGSPAPVSVTPGGATAAPAGRRSRRRPAIPANQMSFDF